MRLSFFIRLDIGAQHRVHPRQMTGALLFEPLEYVAVDSQMHRGFSGGITTRARFQKSAPTGDASGALARVLLAPRETFLLIALTEYLAVVSFCVISIGLPGAGHAPNCQIAIIHICVHIIKISDGSCVRQMRIWHTRDPSLRLKNGSARDDAS